MEWQELTRMTGGRLLVVERVRVAGSEVRVEGEFELPALAALAAEDQVFVAAFLRSHGSIKAMEKLFGISYPTVKGRLNRLAERLPLVEVDAPQGRMEVLERLERGEVGVDGALDLLRGGGEP